ncbi:MAG: hypothetical protein L0G99_10745 [Propionibacteriales bacterium]|nr:hypothetical protein [Propionibacteriales bacterium]
MPARPDFPTPQMFAAERELDADIEIGLARARELQSTLDENAKEEAEREAAEAQVEPQLMTSDQLQSLVSRHAMTPEWRTVIDRIDRGQTSWDHVLTSLRSATADQEVSAAFQSLASVAPPTPEELHEFGIGPDPAANDDTADAPTPGSPRS